MAGIHLTYSAYYTHFSFLLFLVSLVLPFTSPIKYFILLNSLIVGIVGNVLFIQDYSSYIKWYQKKYPDLSIDQINLDIQIGNALFHTLPMIVSSILIQGCSIHITTVSQAMQFLYYELISILIWSMIPFENKVVVDKISYTYPASNYLATYVLVSCIICFGMIYVLKRC
jgi:hypothetical protein